MPGTAKDPTPDRPTVVEILEELMDLSVGLGVMLMPMLVLAVPGLILLALPALLLLPVLALLVVGAVIAAPPYLLFRFVRRRRRRSGPAPAGPAPPAARVAPPRATW
jgi:ABC-type polysaccharide/polyol phosphate export permease